MWSSSTCVMKPDYQWEDGGLGISHSVTHRCSLETARVRRSRRARKKGRTKQRGGMGWRAGSRLWEKREKYRNCERHKMKNKWKEVEKKEGKRKAEKELSLRKSKRQTEVNGLTNSMIVLLTQAPPGVCNASRKVMPSVSMCCLFVVRHHTHYILICCFYISCHSVLSKIPLCLLF